MCNVVPYTFPKNNKLAHTGAVGIVAKVTKAPYKPFIKVHQVINTI